MSKAVLERNYFTLEKVSSDDLETIKKTHNKMIDLGIIQKYQDPKNIELDEEDQKWEFTENFNDYMTEALFQTLWHLDVETGRLKKFANPKTARKAKHRHDEFNKMRKVWRANGGNPDKFFQWYQVMTLADIILEFKIINQVIHDYDPDLTETEPVHLPMKEIFRLANLERQKLDEEGNTEYEDMARQIYGWKRYKYESEADRLLTKRLVYYDLMTDTGHLTRFFMDYLKQCSEEAKMTMEQIAQDESMLFALVVEGTREEDFDNANEYLKKKSKVEIGEYHEMARILGRLLKLEIVKQKEESQ